MPNPRQVPSEGQRSPSTIRKSALFATRKVYGFETIRDDEEVMTKVEIPGVGKAVKYLEKY